MKRLIAIILFTFMATSLQAQTWSNFWHPREKQGLKLGTSSTRYEFKPVITVIATSFTPVTGGPWETGIVNGAGPGLSLQNTTQDEYGVNYVNYSATLSGIFGGSSTVSPNFQASLALMAGALNNLVSVGVKYDLFQPSGGKKRFAILLGTQISLTLN